MTPKVLQFCRFEERHAAAMLSWRYPPPYEMYNAHEGSTDTAIRNLLRPELHYMAVLNETGNMIAFRCFGEDARVPGGDYSKDALDLGGGLRPDLTGQGLGRQVIAAAMAYAVQTFRPRFFRTTIASFNFRAKKTCEHLGYRVVSAFTRTSDGLPFEVMIQPARKPVLSIPLIE